MRYFIELCYKGTNYHGWQRQPNAISVQQTLEEALTVFLRTETPIVGCGRTDAGVHAQQYFAHFDSAAPIRTDLAFRLNQVLPDDIVVFRVFEVEAGQHARFDATHRAYAYHILTQQSPFETETTWFYSLARRLDTNMLQEAAQVLLDFDAFFPFCKSNTDTKTMLCDLRRSEWEVSDGRWIYQVAADRFLRGMVRLIVGMCINVAAQKITLAEVRHALETQTRLPKSYSVPPQGLFLTDIRYDFI